MKEKPGSQFCVIHKKAAKIVWSKIKMEHRDFYKCINLLRSIGVKADEAARLLKMDPDRLKEFYFRWDADIYQTMVRLDRKQ